MFRFSVALLVVVITMTCLSGFSQQFNYRHFSVDDGLPTNEVYHIMQDQAGYMWISTDYGVCRYNGQKFEVFTIADGLPSNVVFESYEDSKGRIWFRTMSKKLSFFENDSIYTIPWNDGVKKGLSKEFNKGYITFVCEAGEYLYLCTQFESIIQLKMDNLNEQHIYLIHNVSAIQDAKNKIVLKNDSHINSFLRFHRNSRKEKRFILQSNRYLSTTFNKGMIHINDTLNFLVSEKSVCLYIHQKMEVSKTLPAKIYSVSYQHGLIYLGTEKGLFTLSAKTLEEYYPCLFPEKLITGVYLDRENNLWISSLNNGVYFIGMPELIFENELVSDSKKSVKKQLVRYNVASKQEELLVGYQSGKVDVIQSRKLSHQKKSISISSTLSDMIHVENETMIVTGGISLRMLDYNYNMQEEEHEDIGLKHIGIYDGAAYFSYNDILYKKEGKEIREVGGISPITCLLGVEYGLYIGGYGSLLRYTPEKTVELLSGKVNGVITAIEKGVSDVIWVATRGSGLFCIDNKGSVVAHYTTENGLLSNYCTSIWCAGNGDVWVGSTQGVQFMTQSNNKDKLHASFKLDTWMGLISNSVTSLAWFDERLWIGTKTGLTILNTETIKKDTVPVPVFINEMEINGNVTVDLTKNNDPLNYKENTISFGFYALSYKDPNVSYKYRLTGLDSLWIETMTPFVHYSQLSPGKYAFEVLAKNSSGIWNKIPASVRFEISPAFWQTVWFWLVIAFFLLSLVFWVIRWRFNQLKTQNELSESLMKARQQALNAQMNPHFVFNALNSINSYVLEKKSMMASRYLGKFSALVRSTLENSFHETVPLYSEIQLIENYLELEKIRFEDKFEYQINIDEAVDDQTHIPPLLLQPFLENSIWHGLVHKNTKGNISIQIKSENNQIHVTIEDDGIGRKEAGRIKKQEKHTSRGMMITRKRLQLAQERFKENFKVKTTDLYDTVGKALGTRIDIWLGKMN